MEKNFYSIKEAADYLQVDYKVVYRLVREGKIPSSRVGWQYRMTQEDLNAYLNAQRAKQSAGSGPTGAKQAAKAPRPVARPANGNGAVARVKGVSRVQARQMEASLLSRYRQTVEDIAAIQHPSTKETRYVDNWEAICSQTDSREALLQILNTAFLDRKTLTTTPLNSRVRYHVPGDPPLILELRFLARLERFCTTGADDAPASLEDIEEVLTELRHEHSHTGAAYIVGLASPTGWSQEAMAAVGKASTPEVRLFLIDPHTGAVFYDEQDPETGKYAGLFRLPTAAEDRVSLAEQLRAELNERSGVILRDFAATLGADIQLVLEAAQEIEREGRHRLLEDASVGPMLVNV